MVSWTFWKCYKESHVVEILIDLNLKFKLNLCELKFPVQINFKAFIITMRIWSSPKEISFTQRLKENPFKKTRDGNEQFILRSSCANVWKFNYSALYFFLFSLRLQTRKVFYCCFILFLLKRVQHYSIDHMLEFCLWYWFLSLPTVQST